MAFVHGHWRSAGTGKRGAPFVYSDAAIQLRLMLLKVVFHLPYRALEGFARSLMRLMALGVLISDPLRMPRGVKALQIAIPRRACHKSVHVMLDSTGFIKASG